MALLTANNQSMTAITALPSAVAKGGLVLLETQTASSDGTLDFTSNIDSTYKEYIFKCTSMHPQTNNQAFQVNFTIDGTNWNVTKTTTLFRSQHDEADTATSGPFYKTAQDLAQATGDQILSTEVGNGNDECTSGTLHLYDPSSTTFVKHFMSTFNCYMSFDYSNQDFVAGYCNTTSAVTGARFLFGSGNVDAGTIKMYGVT